MAPQPRGWRKVQSTRLLKDIIEKRTLGEIAKAEGISERAVNYRMLWPEFQEMLAKFSMELTQTAQKRIDELWSSDDPLDKRAAAQLTVSMLKIFSPKISHSTTQSLNYNIDEKRIQIQKGLEGLTPEENEALKKTLLKMEKRDNG